MVPIIEQLAGEQEGESLLCLVGLGLGRKGRQEGRGTACFARGCDSRLFLVQGVKATEDGEGQRIRAMGR